METDTVESISECRTIAEYTLYSEIGNLPFLGSQPVFVTDFAVKFPLYVSYPRGDSEFGRNVRVGSLTVDRKTLDIQRTPQEIIDERVSTVCDNPYQTVYEWEHCF